MKMDHDSNNDNDHHGGGDHSMGKDDDRKLFIGGLSWETTEKDLRDHFSKYGGIESLTLKTDPSTGRSRGFAFIVFSSSSTLDKVIQAGEHVINGKKIDPKKAKARTGKVFVGGLIQEITDDDIRNYFNQFGNVVEIEMPIDKTKNQRKGFCFVTFDNEQVVHDLLKSPKQKICGKEVDVKKAQPSGGGMKGGLMGWNGMGGGGGMGGSGGFRGGRGNGRGGGGRGGVGGRGGRSDWSTGSYYSSSPYSPYAAPSSYYDYYGGGYGSGGGSGSYGSYGGSTGGGGGGGDYGGGSYGSYDSSYGYDTASPYDSTTNSTSSASRGRGGRGMLGGKTRPLSRHVPY